MAYIDVDIPMLDIGAIETIGPFMGGYRWQDAAKRPLRLEIIATDGTRIEADMPKHAPPDALDILEGVWLGLTYGDPGSDEEQTLADLRQVFADRKARMELQSSEAAQ